MEICALDSLVSGYQVDLIMAFQYLVTGDVSQWHPLSMEEVNTLHQLPHIALDLVDLEVSAILEVGAEEVTSVVPGDQVELACLVTDPCFFIGVEPTIFHLHASVFRYWLQTTRLLSSCRSPR